jgi:hypothetical protein
MGLNHGYLICFDFTFTTKTTTTPGGRDPQKMFRLLNLMVFNCDEERTVAHLKCPGRRAALVEERLTAPQVSY